MATLPVQIELSEAQYLVLLKHAKGSSRVAARLLRAVEHETSARGGKKGGKSRMASLTPEQRSELARKAARARWSKAKREK